MRFILLAAFAVLALFSLPANAAGVRVNAFDRVFGHVPCNARGVCIVKYNPGGVIDDFKRAASAINRTSFQVVIAGPCMPTKRAGMYASPSMRSSAFIRR